MNIALLTDSLCYKCCIYIAKTVFIFAYIYCFDFLKNISFINGNYSVSVCTY